MASNIVFRFRFLCLDFRLCSRKPLFIFATCLLRHAYHASHILHATGTLDQINHFFCEMLHKCLYVITFSGLFLPTTELTLKTTHFIYVYIIVWRGRPQYSLSSTQHPSKILTHVYCPSNNMVFYH